MLFPISANKHEYTQVNGLNVDEPNEKIKGLLNFITVPDRNQIDFNAFILFKKLHVVLNHVLKKVKNVLKKWMNGKRSSCY